MLSLISKLMPRGDSLSLDSALSQLCWSKGVFRPKFVNRESRVEECAKFLGISNELICRQVAELVRLPVSEKLRQPSLELVRLTGYEASELESRYLMPQPCCVAPAGYSISLAFPELVDRAAFIEFGVPIRLCLASEVKRLWEIYFGSDGQLKPAISSSPRLSLPIISALARVAEDCRKVGATEVFLGHPSVGCFECLTAEGRLSGEIHRLIIETLYQLIESERPYEINLSAMERLFRRDFAGEYPNIRGLSLARTKNFEGPVIYMTWEAPAAVTIASSSVISPVGPPQATGILVIEDDRRFAQLLAGILRRNLCKDDYFVDICCSVDAALDLLRSSSSRYGAIISDLQMPERGGRDLVNQLRCEGLTTPVILLTSDDSLETESEMILSGATAFIRKQEDPKVLLAWVEKLCGAASKNDHELMRLVG